MINIYEEIAKAQQQNKKAVMCIVIQTSGSSPQKPGSKMLIFEDGFIVGTIGGGAVEKKVIDKAKEIMALGSPQKLSFNLEDDLAMHCGGSMDIYIEPINPKPSLFIFGAGHVGKALTHFAYYVGFEIYLIDPRENIFNQEQESIYHCIKQHYIEAIDHLSLNQQSYVVVVTPKHAYDESLVAILGKRDLKYLGMIGSKNKVALLKEKFLSEQILTQEQLQKIDMPIGVKIAAKTPEEIAISIVAKLIDVKNQQ